MKLACCAAARRDTSRCMTCSASMIASLASVASARPGSIVPRPGACRHRRRGSLRFVDQRGRTQHCTRDRRCVLHVPDAERLMPILLWTQPSAAMRLMTAALLLALVLEAAGDIKAPSFVWGSRDLILPAPNGEARRVSYRVMLLAQQLNRACSVTSWRQMCDRCKCTRHVHTAPSVRQTCGPHRCRRSLRSSSKMSWAAPLVGAPCVRQRKASSKRQQPRHM